MEQTRGFYACNNLPSLPRYNPTMTDHEALPSFALHTVWQTRTAMAHLATAASLKPANLNQDPSLVDDTQRTRHGEIGEQPANAASLGRLALDGVAHGGGETERAVETESVLYSGIVDPALVINPELPEKISPLE